MAATAVSTRVALALTLATSVFAFVQSSVSPLLPAVQRRFDADASQVTWVVTIYLVSAAVTTPLLARCGDAFGRRRVLLIVLGCFAVGCATAAQASSLWMLLVARAIQGTAGVLVPLSVAILRDVMPPHRVAGSIGRLSGLLAVGSAVAVVVAGPMTARWGYSSVFWLPFVLSVTAFGLAFLTVPESPTGLAELPSLVSLLLFAGWVILLLLSVSELPRRNWPSSWSLGVGGALFVLVAAWWRVEGATGRPLIAPEVRRLQQTWATGAVAFALGATIFGNLALVPQFLQAGGAGLGLTLTTAGLCLLPQTLGFILGGVLAAPLAGRMSSRRVILIGGVCSTLAYGALVALRGDVLSVALLTTLSGFGNGMAGAILPSIVVTTAPVRHAAAAAGVNANIRLVGGAIGAQAVVAIGLHGATASGTRLAAGFALLALLSLSSALLSLCIVTPSASDDRVAGRERPKTRVGSRFLRQLHRPPDMAAIGRSTSPPQPRPSSMICSASRRR